VLDYIKDRYEPAVYFDEDKYHLPTQCETMGDAPAKFAEYKAYHESIEAATKKMKAEADDEMAQGKKELQDASLNYKAGDKFASPAFNELAAQMLLVVDNKLTADGGLPEIGRQQKKYKKTMQDLQDQLEKDTKTLDCPAKEPFEINFMEKAAIATRDYQKAYLRIYKEFYDESVFWERFYVNNKHIQKASFLRRAAGLLDVLGSLATTVCYYGCGPMPELQSASRPMEQPLPDCGIDIGFKCVVGSFHIDCEKISFSTKAVLLLNVDHSFANHRTTIMIGAGEDLAFGKRSIGNISGEFGVAGYMKYFVNFDGTRVSDQGFKWKSSISYTQEITNDFGFKPIETANVDLTAETTLSVANGWTFKGSLYDKLGQLISPGTSEGKK